MSVTMRDIAESCGVSCGAVSQILKDPNHPRFLPETRQKVLKAAGELNYRQNRLSLALRTRKSNLIGFLYPWNCPEVVDNFERAISENGYKMMPMFTPSPRPGREREILESFLDWKVDGILWEPSYVAGDCLPLLEQIHKNGPPLLFLQHRVSDLPFPSLEIDIGTALIESVVHASKQGYHTAVIFLTQEQQTLHGGDVEILQKACRENGMKLKKVPVKSAQTPEEYCASIKKVFDASPKDGGLLFYLFNIFTPRFLECAAGLGLKSTADFGYVMLFDILIGNTIRIADILIPKATVVRVDYKAFAFNAVNHLLMRIDRKQEIPPLQSVKAELIIQNSTIR